VYLDPRLEPILKRTQGIPIFQEQAMAIAMELAHYTGAEADRLRRTMGNHRKEARLTAALAELRERLVQSRVADDVAAQIEADLRGFANYGFPESHAWSFALIAYATAWLKTHHPTEFYFGLLNAQPMGFYPVSTLLHDARWHGVPLLPPCLRDGQRDCTTVAVENEARRALRVGWRFVRGVGTHCLDRLEAAREAAPFRSIADVVVRSGLERTSAAALARADAFAAWEPDRRRAAWEALRAAGDTMPLAPAPDVVLTTRPLSRHHRILLDYFSTGFCLDGHPMEVLRERLERLRVHHSESIRFCRDGETVLVAGLVIARQRPSTAKGTVFLLLEDEYGHLNVIVPVSVAGADREVVQHALVMLIEGKIEWEGDHEVLQIVGKRFQSVRVPGLTHRSRDFR
jgi:error-prone DNA polymerase